MPPSQGEAATQRFRERPVVRGVTVPALLALVLAGCGAPTAEQPEIAEFLHPEGFPR